MCFSNAEEGPASRYLVVPQKKHSHVFFFAKKPFRRSFFEKKGGCSRRARAVVCQAACLRSSAPKAKGLGTSDVHTYSQTLKNDLHHTPPHTHASLCVMLVVRNQSSVLLHDIYVGKRSCRYNIVAVRNLVVCGVETPLAK